MSDDKIAEIRARHNTGGILSGADRGWLLAEVERLRADLAIQQGCCDGAAAQDAHVRREREEHRAENEKLREEIEYLRKAHQTAIEWSNLYRADNIRMRYEIERMKEDGR